MVRLWSQDKLIVRFLSKCDLTEGTIYRGFTIQINVIFAEVSLGNRHQQETSFKMTYPLSMW
jgi:hypothetical protein